MARYERFSLLGTADALPSIRPWTPSLETEDQYYARALNALVSVNLFPAWNFVEPYLQWRERGKVKIKELYPAQIAVTTAPADPFAEMNMGPSGMTAAPPDTRIYTPPTLPNDGWLAQVLAQPLPEAAPMPEPLPTFVTNFSNNSFSPGGEYYYPLLLVKPGERPPSAFVFVGAAQEFIGATYYVEGSGAFGRLHVLAAGEHLARGNKPNDTVSPMSLSEGQLSTMSLWQEWKAAGKPAHWGAGFHHRSTGGWISDVELGLEIAGVALATGLTAGAGAPLLAAAVAAVGGEAIADPSSVTAVGHVIGHAGQQIADEVTRIPANIAGYIQNPRSFIQAAAQNLADGWGAPLLLLLGPIAVPALLAIQAGANAHNLSDFGIAVGREAAKGGAVDLTVGLLATMAGIPIGSIGINPLVLGIVGDIVVPNQALIGAAKATQYIQGFIPFFPEAISELTIQAQRTEKERDTLRLKLAQLQAQIERNGGLWYAEAKVAFHAIISVCMAIATAGAGFALTAIEQTVMQVAQTCLSAAGTVLQLVNAKQTLIAAHAQQRQENTQREGTAQSELDALRAKLAALQNQAKNKNTTSVSAPPYGKIAIGVAVTGGLLYAVRTHRKHTGD